MYEGYPDVCIGLGGIVGPGKVRQVCSGMRFTGELQGRAAGRL